jgi:hypothetical protein
MAQVRNPRGYFYRGEFRPSGFFYGQRVNKDTTETVREHDYVDKDGVEQLTFELIDPGRISKCVEYL